MRCIPLVSWHSSAIEMIIHFSFSIRMLAGLYVNDILSILIFLFLSFLDFFSQFKKKKKLSQVDLLGETPTRAAQSRENNSKSSVNVWPRTARLFSLVRVSIFVAFFIHIARHPLFFLLTFEILNAHDKHQEEVKLLYYIILLTFEKSICPFFLSFFLLSALCFFYTCTYIFFYHPICIYKCATPRLFCRNPDVFSPSLTLRRIWLVSFSIFFSRQDKQEKKKSK